MLDASRDRAKTEAVVVGQGGEGRGGQAAGPGQRTTTSRDAFQAGAPPGPPDCQKPPLHTSGDPLGDPGHPPYTFGGTFGGQVDAPCFSVDSFDTQDHATHCSGDPFSSRIQASCVPRESFGAWSGETRAFHAALHANGHKPQATTCMDPTEVLGKAGGKIDRGEPGGRRTAAEGHLAASCSTQATGRRGQATCLEQCAFQPFGQPLCQAGPPAEPGRKTEPTQPS